MQQNDLSKLPPVNRWSRPGFVSRVVGSKKPENFVISDYLKNNNISLNVGGIRLQFQNEKWVNLDEPRRENQSAKRIDLRKLEMENSQLQLQCEVLLHMLTLSELKKAKHQGKLDQLKKQISNSIDQYESSQIDD